MLLHESVNSVSLSRSVALHIHLPENTDRGARFPVLYMYDGGVVFRDAPSGFGFEERCHVDSNSLPNIILVGIEPPRDRWQRTAEFSPYTKSFDTHGADFEPVVHGRGELLLSFVIHELKPWIDGAFPTLSSRKDTAIGGMSSGALNAMYAAMRHSNVFSRFLLHGPAFNLWLPELLETARGVSFADLRYCYMDIGTQDVTRMSTSEQTMHSALCMRDVLLSGGLDGMRLRFRTIPDGRHSPNTWRTTFPDALRWIFQDCGNWPLH